MTNTSYPWNKGKKTGIAPWKGKKLSDEHRKNLSEAHKGKNLWGKGLSKYKTVRIWDGTSKVVKLHRYLMGKILGRPLSLGEVVHHWDGDKQNNDLDNLGYFRHDEAHKRLHNFAKRHGLPIEKMKFSQSWLKTL